MLRYLKPEIVIGFLTATVLWIGVLGWQASYAPTELQKQECHGAAYKSEDCKSFWEKATTDPVAFFTFVLAVSTIGLWVATILLYLAGERQIKGSRKIAALQARQTRDAIREARRSADVAESALVKLERPYLFVLEVGRLETQEFWDGEEGDVGHTLSVTYSVANHGKIPAIVKGARESLSVHVEPLKPNLGDFDHPLIVAPILAAGEKRPDTKVDLGWNDFRTDDYGITVPDFGQHTLFLRVVITYRGPFNGDYETSIGLRYDERTRRFVEFHTGEKYNYQS